MKVWDVDLQRHEGTVKDLINYQNKCRIIRGWDYLFNKLKENINQVAAMKLSPYYKVRI